MISKKNKLLLATLVALATVCSVTLMLQSEQAVVAIITAITGGLLVSFMVTNPQLPKAGTQKVKESLPKKHVITIVSIWVVTGVLLIATAFPFFSSFYDADKDASTQTFIPVLAVAGAYLLVSHFYIKKMLDKYPPAPVTER